MVDKVQTAGSAHIAKQQRIRLSAEAQACFAGTMGDHSLPAARWETRRSRSCGEMSCFPELTPMQALPILDDAHNRVTT